MQFNNYACRFVKIVTLIQWLIHFLGRVGILMSHHADRVLIPGGVRDFY